METKKYLLRDIDNEDEYFIQLTKDQLAFFNYLQRKGLVTASLDNIDDIVFDIP